MLSCLCVRGIQVCCFYFGTHFVLHRSYVKCFVNNIRLTDIDIQKYAKHCKRYLRSAAFHECLEDTFHSAGMNNKRSNVKKHIKVSSEKLIATENFTPSQCDFKVMHTKAYSCTSRCRVSRDNLLGLVCSEELPEECKHITKTVCDSSAAAVRRALFKLIFFFF